ncbi:MAG: prepilin-type N-terminal cleavage/methylation domain-containing protein [Candidatus Omnitrophota bacterium]|nr:prepilin-type N-terminal cleavage/methylation domain-containing protein [Candidatus Omnitrophota bacterium]
MKQKAYRGRKHDSGFTLVEMVLSVALFSMVLVALYATLDMARVIFNTGSAYSQVTQSVMQTLRFISREIGQTSPNLVPVHFELEADDDGNSIVRFQIPVDWDNDGDAIEGTLDPDVEWGAYDDAGQTRACHADTPGTPECDEPDHAEILDRWVRYRVIEGPTEDDGDEQLVREVLDADKNLIEGSASVVSNNVAAFNVGRDGESVQMTLTVTVAHETARDGGTRNVDSTFTSRTLLRNAVN